MREFSEIKEFGTTGRRKVTWYQAANHSRITGNSDVTRLGKGCGPSGSYAHETIYPL